MHFRAKARQDRGPRSAPAVCTTTAIARCPAPAGTHAAALRAPIAAATETIGIPYASLIPADVRMRHGGVRVFEISLHAQNALRFLSNEAAAFYGCLQINQLQKSAEYRDSLDIL